MNKGFRFAMYVSVAFLGLMDLYIIYKLMGASGQTVFTNIMLYFVPVGLLMSVCTVLSYIKKEMPLKVLAGITIAVNLILLLLDFMAVLEMMSAFDKMQAVAHENWLEFVQLCGYGVLLLANIFLMVYIYMKEFKYPALITFGIAAVTLLVDFGLMIASNIDYFNMNDGSGFWNAVISGLNLDNNPDILLRIISILCYVVVYGTVTKLLYDKSEAKNG